jgi:hypothetical protein
MNKTIIAICVVCKKPFMKLTGKNTSHRLPRKTRQVNAITCSKICSSKYIYFMKYGKIAQ